MYFIWIFHVGMEKKSTVCLLFKCTKPANISFNCNFYSKSDCCSTLSCKNAKEKYEIRHIFSCVIMEQIAEIYSALYMNCFHKANWLFFKELTSNKGFVFKQRCTHKLWQLSSSKDCDLSPTVLGTGRKGLAELLCRKRGPCRSEVGSWHKLQLSHRQVLVWICSVCFMLK